MSLLVGQKMLFGVKGVVGRIYMFLVMSSGVGGRIERMLSVDFVVRSGFGFENLLQGIKFYLGCMRDLWIYITVLPCVFSHNRSTSCSRSLS
jgi:hypothetical protein